MKQLLIYTLAMAICFGLSACKETAGQELTSATIPIPETAAAAQTIATAAHSVEQSAYEAVLSGAMAFTDASTGNILDITRLSETITTEDIPCSIRQLAVVDLDQDESDELILWLRLGQDDYAGFVVLRYQDGTVYGYPRSYRSFLALKQDGTFRLSGGVSYTGFASASFSGTMGVIFPLAEAETALLPDGSSSTIYRINGETVTEEEYLTFDAEQAAKPDALWYESWEDYLKNTDLG